MRYLIISLMIVLLPLRGWAVDSMAAQMVSTLVAMETAATGAHEISDVASFDTNNRVLSDCHESVGLPSDASATADAAMGIDNCSTCQTCQACHAVALSSSPPRNAAIFTSTRLRVTHTVSFTSAAAALGQKPPIS